MNVLVYLATPPRDCTLGQHLDMAIDEIKKGNHVVLLSCDYSVGNCIVNPCGNSLYCSFCKLSQKAAIAKYIPEAEHLWMSDYISQIKKNDIPRFRYNTAAELRALQFEGIEIGLGAMSSYISLTRNLNPKIDNKSRLYFDKLLEQQLLSYHAIKNLDEKYQFGLFIFQNGRGIEVKPILNYCQTRNKDFWCSETIHRGDITFLDNYWDDFPHSMKAKTKNIFDCWEQSAETEDEKRKTGISFFERRRHAKSSGDRKIYVKDQKEGLLPEDWDSTKENIVIFNSSEDEKASVSRTYDEGMIFPSQLEGIKAILDHFKDDANKHFTLRVHPNLNGITYQYHTDLYKLNYPNLTVIPGTSPISTYALMDAADKVVVFGSTTGIEAAYDKKAVICAGPSYYRDLDAVYLPKSIEEIYSLIDTKDLPSLYNDKVLYYGYYIMRRGHLKAENVDIDRYKKSLFGKSIRCYNYQTFMGSNFLFGVIHYLFHVTKKTPLFCKIKELPREEA